MVILYLCLSVFVLFLVYQFYKVIFKLIHKPSTYSPEFKRFLVMGLRSQNFIQRVK